MNGQRALVTGGSKGIGRATAVELARAGWSVAIVARGQGDLTKVVEECRSHSPSVVAVEVDVRTPAGPDAIREQVVEAWGGVDVLINNVGVFSEGPLETLSAEDLDDAWEINARAMILTTQALIGDLRASGGHVINIGSRSAVMGIAGESAFCATKAAVAGFSAALRAEVKGSGIKVSCIHPGPVNTWGATGEDAAGLMKPEEVAELLRYVAESEAEFYDVRFGMPE